MYGPPYSYPPRGDWVWHRDELVMEPAEPKVRDSLNIEKWMGGFEHTIAFRLLRQFRNMYLLEWNMHLWSSMIVACANVHKWKLPLPPATWPWPVIFAGINSLKFTYKMLLRLMQTPNRGVWAVSWNLLNGSQLLQRMAGNSRATPRPLLECRSDVLVSRKGKVPKHIYP